MQCLEPGLGHGFLGRPLRIGAVGALLGFSAQFAYADEAGVSFWLPGQLGSLAAVPATPGWSLGTVYYHTSVTASGSVTASREIEIGRFPASVNVSSNAKWCHDYSYFEPVLAVPVVTEPPPRRVSRRS